MDPNPFTPPPLPFCWDKIRLPGDIPLLLQKIPATGPQGFRMGSRGYAADEEPIHRVVIPDVYYLGTYVVTQEQYSAIAQKVPILKKRSHPSSFKGDRNPVESVDWTEANQFCRWLSKNIPVSQLPPDGFNLFCLPTEAEWEHACRAGSGWEYYHGDGENALAQVGWFSDNSGGSTHPVDEKPERHPYGLCGMHGNVGEWCHDLYEESAYRKRNNGLSDPERDVRLLDWNTWNTNSEVLTDAALDYRSRVIRGGSWSYSAWRCGSAFRIRWGPDVRIRDQGFRVCLVRGPVSQPSSHRASKLGEGEAGAGSRSPREDVDERRLPRRSRPGKFA